MASSFSWFDESGESHEVELSTDPRDELASDLVTALECFIQIDDADVLRDRFSLLSELTSSWLVFEAPDPHVLEGLKDQARADSSTARNLPALIVRDLIEIPDCDEHVRTAHALYDLVSSFADLLTDHEKLLGHLILEHDVDFAGVSIEDESALLALHILAVSERRSAGVAIDRERVDACPF